MQFNLSGPFFDVSDGVRLLCSASTTIAVNATAYGRSRFNTPSYGAPFYTAAGMILVSVTFSTS
jgi:hypothetical protein